MYEVVFRINSEYRRFYYEYREDAMHMAGFCFHYAGSLHIMGDSVGVSVVCPDGEVITDIPTTYETVEY